MAGPGEVAVLDGVAALQGGEREPIRSVSIVVPVYNEQTILPKTVDRLRRGVRRLPLDSWEIILCENGSADETRRLAEEAERRFRDVRLLTLERPDYGAAMRAGFLASRGDAIVNFDADYYDLGFLATALGQEADIVVAAKGLAGSHDARDLLRRMVSRAFGWLVRRLLGLRVTETHGMKLFRRRAIEGLLPQVRSTKDLFDTELLALAERAGLSIVELPVRTEEQRHSRSGILRRIPRTLWGLIRIRTALRNVAPLDRVRSKADRRPVGAAA
jgi:glycosyltransferase involved in cell wall biosynthesis